jgi:hypothetical protein
MVWNFVPKIMKTMYTTGAWECVAEPDRKEVTGG